MTRSTSSSSRFRTLTIAACASAATLLVSGLVPNGSAQAQRGDPMTQCVQRLQRAERKVQIHQSRSSGYQAAYQELRTAMLRMEKVTTQRVTDYRARNALQRIAVNSRRRASAHVPRRRGYQPRQPRYTPPPPPPPVVVAPPPPPVPRGPQAITHRSFRRFSSAVRRSSFDRDRVALVRDMSRRVAFSSAQVVALMRLCSFDKSRVDVAAALYRNVLDPAEWYRVYPALSFSSSRKKLRQRLRRHRR